MKYKIDAVIFDFDGVIVDSGADIASAIQFTQRHFKRPVMPTEEIISYVGHGADMLVRNCFKGAAEELVQQAMPFYRKYYLANAIVKTSLYENVRETLQSLKQPASSKKTALVTNKPEDLTYRIIEGLGVRDYFDLVIGPESVNRMKPDPEGILKAIELFGVSAENTIMIGDSHTDIEAGKKAGTITCGVTYGLGDRAELAKAKPDFSIGNMLELLNFIY